MIVKITPNEFQIGMLFACYMYSSTFNKKVWVVGEYDAELYDAFGCYDKIAETESRVKAYFIMLKKAFFSWLKSIKTPNPFN